MTELKYMSIEELEAGLENIRQSPKDRGRLELIVRRPQLGEREVLEEGQLDLIQGLMGDNWIARGSTRRTDGTAHPDMQITIMNTRLIALLAQEKSHWQLAGDQLFVDLDLSLGNLPLGTQLSLGAAVIEVTDQPHTGCVKFSGHYGLDAVKFISSPEGKELRLRGIYTKVVKPGLIRIGDLAKKI
jgi:MOSC domain-containing protein YiiM